jgi:hypothetical protein
MRALLRAGRPKKTVSLILLGLVGPTDSSILNINFGDICSPGYRKGHRLCNVNAT